MDSSHLKDIQCLCGIYIYRNCPVARLFLARAPRGQERQQRQSGGEYGAHQPVPMLLPLAKLVRQGAEEVTVDAPSMRSTPRCVWLLPLVHCRRPVHPPPCAGWASCLQCEQHKQGKEVEGRGVDGEEALVRGWGKIGRLHRHSIPC